MKYTRKDFSRSGVYFNPKNFKKGDIFWYTVGEQAFEITSDWDLTQTTGKVQVRRISTGTESRFYREQRPLYFRLKKTPVKDTTMNHKEIKKQIESFPGICSDGKKAVAKILENFGYVPPVDKSLIPDGLYQNPKTRELIVVKDDNYQYAVSYTIKPVTPSCDYVKTEGWIKLGDLNTLIQLKRVLRNFPAI